MSLKQIRYRMDIGRMIILPIFSIFLITNILGVIKDARALEPVSTIKIATFINHALLVCSYAMLVFLYLIRSVAKSTTRSFLTKTIAVVATFLPFTIPLLSRPSDNPNVLILSSLITILGMAIVLYSLGTLGRSFSIIPQARGLVQSGPYGLVRHPVYLGELISILGVVLARLSAIAMTIYCLLIALLIYRALKEERLLVDIYPEYEAYCLKRARFIPGVF
jgi:protein-S-isoprenylcysteine O-methyltransferase Ste14